MGNDYKEELKKKKEAIKEEKIKGWPRGGRRCEREQGIRRFVHERVGGREPATPTAVNWRRGGYNTSRRRDRRLFIEGGERYKPRLESRRHRWRRAEASRLREAGENAMGLGGRVNRC
nr:hypothetical protein Iba_chr14cCG8300 [Ipomoea batatas]